MRLLLHICCAPCLEYPYQSLIKDNIDFEGYFFNPNIQPAWEYKRRKQTLQQFTENHPLQIHYSNPSDDMILLNTLSFENKWNSFPLEERCKNCYRIRLHQTALFAKENGFDAFTSTLLGSIYQNHELICEMAEEAAQKTGIEFYKRDFRDGFRIGQNLAKEQGLYRQKFCGCICSLNQSVLKSKIIASIPHEDELFSSFTV
jgi:predicted adenine nucleotide alpha hydrolase (AANH) superfamily ATPase